jgi:hypothetical protein
MNAADRESQAKPLSEGATFAAEPQASTDSANRADQANTKREAVQTGNAPNQQVKQETRTYKGATYVKGADGQWHLEQK